MVLAAGLGTRLRPLTDLVAKPLVPVGDRPALAHVLGRLRAAGVPRLVVNAHHRADSVSEFVGAGFPDVVVSREEELLGTAGGVALAAGELGPGGVLVWNADILADVDPVAVVAAHRAASGGRAADATLVVQPRPRGEGSVGLDRTGRVVRLRQERVAEEASGGEFLGIHVLGEGLRARLPPRGCLVGDVYIPAMMGGADLRTLIHPSSFFDVGTLRAYLDANLSWLAGRGLASWVGPTARVAAGTALHGTVVGEGASVTGVGTLERCVVWPGAVARAPLADAIVAGEQVVRVG